MWVLLGYVNIVNQIGDVYQLTMSIKAEERIKYQRQFFLLKNSAAQ
jgi:hypothetical protein|tara:strand:- start:363 stop:500 length:138 start_codon:yes stop_codon:yes gene_type:complete